jgi:hypothetical protein
MKQHLCTWRDPTGNRHGKLFISGPCRKRADKLLRLSRRQLKMVFAFLTGHAPVRKHLRTMRLFEGEAADRRLKQYSTLFAAARIWPVSAIMFLGVWMLNRQTYGEPQSGTSASSYEAQGH